jgi:DNA repair protein RecO (recombination protein O)
LFHVYDKSVAALQASELEQKTLRSFEKYLLEELGYGLLPKSDAAFQHSLAPEKYYRFIPEHGFVLSEMGDQSQSKSNIFSGKNLLAIAREEWQDEAVLQDAKRLTRFVLAPLLGARPVYSRRLFMQVGEEKPEDR